MDNSAPPHETGFEIAVIGMACRFPGAANADQFWRNLCDGVESITEFSAEELLRLGTDPALLEDPRCVKSRGVLDDIDMFDAGFFGYMPREAEAMDPQQRIFLECAWESLENAGYAPQGQPQRVSVFASGATNMYLMQAMLAAQQQGQPIDSLVLQHGNDKDHLATRTAYRLNLSGPAVNVQTTCSSSLVAVHLACQNLLAGESDMALAGGISISVPQKFAMLYQEEGIFSPDGHCRAFDADGQGTVFSNGVGIVVLKRLSEALADGDSILAVIKGSAVNNDGALKVGYTAPSVRGQSQVVRQALEAAEVDPASLGYIEAHGTATRLGDPVEIEALTQAFRHGTSLNGFCAIGSVKTNIGHLDTAAGIAGLIKAIFAVQYGQIPPSLHFKRPNPKIDFANTPFYVNDRLNPWPRNGGPRRAGVSSFGIGGTNAHAVVEQAPPVKQGGDDPPWQLLSLSAKSPAALDAATANLAAHLEQHPDVRLVDAAYTLHVGRTAWSTRRVVVARDREDAVAALRSGNTPSMLTSRDVPETNSTAFLFSGQGAQHVGMGRDLYKRESLFAAEIDRCAELLRPHLHCDLREILYPSGDDQVAASDRLTQTRYAQPALFAVEYALAKLWMAWGVVPTAMIGHSVGEYTAACLSGVLQLEDALLLVSRRGELMQQMPPGAMTAVALSEEAARARAGGGVSLAAVNSPEMCVLSGPPDEVERLQQELQQEGVHCRRLTTSHAFHSGMMEPILAEFTSELRKVELSPPRIPFVSNLTGTWISPSEATSPDYWTAHLRQTVRFAEGVETLLAKAPVLLEVGPGRTLTALAAQCVEKDREQTRPAPVAIASMRHPQDDQDDRRALLEAVGRLSLAGVNLQWSEFYQPTKCRRIPLPTYAFQRQRYWLEPQRGLDLAATASSLQSKLPVDDWFHVPSWKRSVPPEYLKRTATDAQDDCCLIFADSFGMADRIADELARRGAATVRVAAGDEFRKLDDGRFVMRRRAEDFKRLAESLRREGRSIGRLVYLWLLAALESHSDDEPQQAFDNLVSLAQQFGSRTASQPLAVLVATPQIFDVEDRGQAVHSAAATALGPCRVMSREYPELTCRIVDLARTDVRSTEDGALVQSLLSELESDSDDDIVAYRGGKRWVRIWEAVQLGRSTAANRLRRHGVYLITGGLGGIGLVLGEHLAKEYQAKLVLVSRSPLPPRDQWRSSRAEFDEAVQRKIEKVLAWEDGGAEVLTASADVGHEDEMAEVLEAAVKRFGKLDGVIHAAGVAGGGLIQLKAPEQRSAVLTPKVQGTRILERLTRTQDLDFFVLCSSVDAVLAPFGQSDYCAANAFLDAFAHESVGEGRGRVISINWDTWAEVGMAVNTAVPEELAAARREALRHAIRPEEGVRAFERIVNSDFPQVVVSTTDWTGRQTRARTATLAAEQTDAEAPASSAPKAERHARPELENDYVAPSNEIEAALVEYYQDEMGIAPVGVEDNFFALGGHSLIMMRLAARVREGLDVELTLQDFFDHPTVAQIGQVVLEKMISDEDAESLEQMLAELEAEQSE